MNAVVIIAQIRNIKSTYHICPSCDYVIDISGNIFNINPKSYQDRIHCFKCRSRYYILPRYTLMSETDYIALDPKNKMHCCSVVTDITRSYIYYFDKTGNIHDISNKVKITIRVMPLAKIIKILPETLTKYKLETPIDLLFMQDYLYEKGLVDIIKKYLLPTQDNIKMILKQHCGKKHPKFPVFNTYLRSIGVKRIKNVGGQSKCNCKFKYIIDKKTQPKTNAFFYNNTPELKKDLPILCNNQLSIHDPLCNLCTYNKWDLSINTDFYIITHSYLSRLKISNDHIKYTCKDEETGTIYLVK